MITLHFIRPWFLLGLFGIFILAILVRKKTLTANAWMAWCDPTLLQALMKSTPVRSLHSFRLLFSGLALLCLAASGPAWKKLPVPLFTQMVPKIILFDISPSMQAADVLPNRLQRGLFVVTDLLQQPHAAPIGLIAYTQEPFIVSPLTEDAQTITALLPSLNTEIAPVGGQNLSAAMEEAVNMLQQSHFSDGSLLVLTGSPPNEAAQETAQHLAKKGILVSILPLAQHPELGSGFRTFAKAGHGLLLSLPQTGADITRWVRFSQQLSTPLAEANNRLPLWHDEGRWFLLPALACFLPLFRRGWLRRLE